MSIMSLHVRHRLQQLLWAGLASSLLLFLSGIALRPAAALPLANGVALVQVGDGRATPYSVRAGDVVTLPVTLYDAADVGTVSAVIGYDPAVLSPVSCERLAGSAFDSGVCNLHYAADAIKFNALSAAGVSGEQPLFRIAFQARDAVGSSSVVTPTAVQLATPQGQNLPVATAGSRVEVVGGAVGEDGLVQVGEPGHGPYALPAEQTLTLSVTLAITGAHSLHTLDLLLDYDPTVLQPGPCRVLAPLMGACNPNFDPAQGLIRLNLVAPSALQGVVQAYELRFGAAPGASAGATSPIVPLIDSAVGSRGEPLYLLPLGANVTLGSPGGQRAGVWLGSPQEDGQFAVSAGLTTTVPVWLSQVEDLGAATLSVSLEPAVVRALGCRPRPEATADWSFCSVYGDHLRASLVSQAGLNGSLPVWEVIFTPAAAAPVGASSPLSLTVHSFGRRDGTPLPVQTHAGTITVGAGSGAGVALLRLGDGGDGGQFDLAANGVLSTPVRVEGANNFGAVTLGLHFDPQIVQPVGCTLTPAADNAMCNLKAGAGELRFNILSSSGISGDLTLASIRWQAAAGAAIGGTSALTLHPLTFADPRGSPLPVQTLEGRITLIPPAAGGEGLTLRLGDGPAYLSTGSTFTLPLTIVPSPDDPLTAGTFLLHYNPAALLVQDCRAGDGDRILGFCNPGYAGDAIRFNLLSATGINTATQAAIFVFTGAGAAAQDVGPAARDAGLRLEPLLLATAKGGTPTAAVESWPLLITGPDNDDDAIPDEIEAGAPNGGDGNDDGIPDAGQAHVTSLPNAADGTYVTLVAPPDVGIADARALAPPPLSTLPQPLEFPLGLFSFVLPDLTP
ncbi:MAG: hypothetical protein D6775_15535, partial [Caldilineae bacterium]